MSWGKKCEVSVSLSFSSTTFIVLYLCYTRYTLALSRSTQLKCNLFFTTHLTHLTVHKRTCIVVKKH